MPHEMTITVMNIWLSWLISSSKALSRSQCSLSIPPPPPRASPRSWNALRSTQLHQNAVRSQAPEAVGPQAPKAYTSARDANADYSNMQLSLPELSELKVVHGNKCKT